MKILPENKWLKVLLFADLIVALVFMILMTVVDAFPRSVVAGLLAMLVGFLVLSILLLEVARLAKLSASSG